MRSVLVAVPGIRQKTREEENKKNSDRAEHSPLFNDSQCWWLAAEPGAAEEETGPKMYRATGSPASSGSTTPTNSSGKGKQLASSAPDRVPDGVSPQPTENELQYEEVEKMSSVLPTMWMGGQTGR